MSQSTCANRTANRPQSLDQPDTLHPKWILSSVEVIFISAAVVVFNKQSD